MAIVETGKPLGIFIEGSLHLFHSLRIKYELLVRFQSPSLLENKVRLNRSREDSQRIYCPKR